MRVPLRLQVFALLLAAFGLTLVAWGSLQTWLSQNRDRRQIEERLERTVGLLLRDRIPLDDGTAARIRDLSGFELTVRDGDGALLAESSPFLASLAPADPSEALTLAAAERTTADDREWFRWSAPLDRRRLGGELLSLELLYPVANWEAARQESLASAWGAALLFVPLGFAAAWFFARRVTSPLSQLRTRLDRLAEGDYAPLAGADRADEIGDTLRAAQALGERLQAYESQVRRQERLSAIGEMGAGVAHQMRNAVTGALLGIDLHRRACDASRTKGEDATKGAEQRTDDEPLDVARRQLANMEVYLRRFLDRGSPASRRREPVDLRQIATKVRDAVAPIALHQRIALRLDAGEEPVFVEGDEVEIEQMLLNVATNAIEAAGDRAAHDRTGEGLRDPRVELSVAIEEGVPALIVRDDGPEPARPLDESIFEPLVSSKPDGAGLGLTVARRVAHDHGATIVASRTGGETTFSIRFPLSRPNGG